MTRLPVVDRRPGARLLAPVPVEPSPHLDIAVIEPEFAAGAGAPFPEVRLVRARCGDGASCAARCPAGSREIAAGRDGRRAAWVMCA